MSWTYDGDMSLQRDRLRFLIQDTNTNDQLVQDEEIALYQSGGAYAAGSDLDAAIALARVVLRKLARQAGRMSAGGTYIDFGGRTTAYRETLEDLERQAAEGASPFAGGISIADVDTRRADTDRVPPFFERDTGDPTSLTAPRSGLASWWR